MTAPDNPPEYNPNIPLTSQTVADVQVPYLDNFTTLYDAFLRNHVALDDPTNPGNHSNIQLDQQEQPISTQSQEIAIYTKKVPGQTDQIFMRYGANGKEFQVTNWQIYRTNPSRQSGYISFLPGGIMVYFGTVFASGRRQQNITLTPAVSTSIMGINLACIGTANPQPNVSVLAPVDGYYHSVTLTSVTPMSDIFYLIFANL